MTGRKGRSGKDHSTTAPKPGGTKDKRKKGNGGKKPGPKPGSKNKK